MQYFPSGWQLCKKLALPLALASAVLCANAQNQQQATYLLNEPVDLSPDYRSFENSYFLADSLQSFDPKTASGQIKWQRNHYFRRLAFNNELAVLRPFNGVVFPEGEYAVHPVLPFSLQFVSARTVRLKAQTSLQARPIKDTLMFANGEPKQDMSAWKYEKISGGHKYVSPFGAVLIYEFPWRIEFRDASGKLLTSTQHAKDFDVSYTPVLPFSFLRRGSDHSRSVSATFSLAPGEKIFGCGESFTQLDKRGQKVVLWVDDANGVQSREMYKPIPFFMSSRGYGMFMHTSTPITCDFGSYYQGANSLMIGDDELDMFVFMGGPKEVLNEYTNITGKSPMPPLWSFGLWMSRITYFTEQEGRDVAALLRKHRIPSDVIHYDTGWFGTDWRCDYKFAADRFKDPKKMLADLKKDGFHVSLWQLPYFVPKNTLYKDIVDKGLAVRDNKGNPPYEDAVLDFSNPATVGWYQEKIGNLLKLGVGAIKVDFGEAAPQNGLFYSGRTGFYEHNLYPVRYNKAVADITKKLNGENIIWARSAWAGSQRYPLHWGGDAETNDMGMAAELRGGLSFGLSGFSFWSHDIGGFTMPVPAELYLRWLPFGMLTSHSRCHGMPPKEPWAYGEAFTNDFRKAVDLKYKLMPYVYAQAKQCTEKGLPMVRALFVEFPEDEGAWLVENEYMFGSDILVAPLMEEKSTERKVYLPKGKWIDYQTGKVYNEGWNTIAAGEVKAIILVKDGTVLPHIQLAQSTMQMDWSNLELVVYAAEGTNAAKGLVCLPSENVLRELALEKTGQGFALKTNPVNGKTNFKTVVSPTK